MIFVPYVDDFRLQSALSTILTIATVTENSVVSLQLNIDGLPILKNLFTQFWPILCRIVCFLKPNHLLLVYIVVQASHGTFLNI